jgi:DNA polymerase elongation subunit (family B)
MRDCRDFVKKYEDVSGFSIYGNTNYEAQYLADEYGSEFDINKIKIVTLDIETQVEHGFPNVKECAEIIQLITLTDKQTKQSTTFGLYPFDGMDNVTYKLCKDEQTLLIEFINYWQTIYPDVVTGWNTDGFDLPYLMRRIELVLGESFVKKLSPWGVTECREKMYEGQFEYDCNIAGVSSLAQLLAVRVNYSLKGDTAQLRVSCSPNWSAQGCCSTCSTVLVLVQVMTTKMGVRISLRSIT